MTRRSLSRWLPMSDAYRAQRDESRRAELDAMVARKRSLSESAARRRAAFAGLRAERALERARQHAAAREAAALPPPHVGHDVFEVARRLAPGSADDPGVQDRRSIVALALLEGRDPAQALADARRHEYHQRPWLTRSIDEPLRGFDGLTLHDRIPSP